MKQHRNILLLLLGLGGFFWYQNLQSVGSTGRTSCRSEITNDSTLKNKTLLIMELEKERQKTRQLEMELSRLGGSTREMQKKQQRIAVMFTGAPRTLTQWGVMKSHVVNVIDALSAGGTDVVDVFFHLNNGTADGARASNNVGQIRQEPFTQERLDRLINLTSPVEVLLHNDSSCSGLDGQIANHSCCSQSWPKALRSWQHNFLQFAFVRDSYQRVKRYETTNNVTYDWVVRMRPDVACFEPMPAARSLSTRRFYLATKERVPAKNTNDYLFVVPRSLSDLFFEKQIMTIFEESCPKRISYWPAEVTMFSYRPYLPYQALPFACVHVLSPTAAECYRFSRHNKRAVPTLYDLHGSRFSAGQTFQEGCNMLVQNGYFGEGDGLGTDWRY